MRSARPARPRSRVATPSATPQRFQDFSKDFKISRFHQRFHQRFHEDFKISPKISKISRFQRRFQDFTKISRFQKRFQDFSWDFSCSVRDFSKWRTPRSRPAARPKYSAGARELEYAAISPLSRVTAAAFPLASEYDTASSPARDQVYVCFISCDRLPYTAYVDSPALAWCLYQVPIVSQSCE